MKQWTREFDTSRQETCMTRWTFHLRQSEGGVVPEIESLEIERAMQGCPGHPKTISALVRNRRIDQIDLKALEQTSCPRPHSCGQVLGHCVESLLKTDQRQA